MGAARVEQHTRNQEYSVQMPRIHNTIPIGIRSKIQEALINIMVFESIKRT
jgi:hypothetical protein